MLAPMRLLISLLVPAIPLLPLLAGGLVGRVPAASAWRVSFTAACLAAAAAWVSAGLVLAQGALTARWTPWEALPGLTVTLRSDTLSAIMTVLVASLGAVILNFSRRYLAGDPAERRFHFWLSLTLGSVLTLVLAGHLLLLWLAWVATSLCLHRLLLLYPERAGAVFSARKKFVFSRLGDVCLLVACDRLHQLYGTWDLEALFTAVEAGQVTGLPAVGFFLVACAALKSAQFPFHSWLPDTMETPTPVSAFMHAGIINAGGFLLVRLSPLLVHAPAALNFIAVLGALTAAFGAVVMLTQPSVKRALAYSTIAQMGFMLLQCGLGAFGLALLHLVAHSLYKAHAFLRSGSTVGATPRAAVTLRTPALSIGFLGGALLVTGLATLLEMAAPFGPSEFDVFSFGLALALAYGLARIWSVGGGWDFVRRSVTAALLIGLASLLLHAGANRLLPASVVVHPPSAVVALVGATFAALFVFQALLWRAGHYSLGRQLYVHALNGFYVGTVANRLLRHLWPRPALR